MRHLRGAGRKGADVSAADHDAAMRAAFEEAAKRITCATAFPREAEGYQDYVVDTYWRFWQAATCRASERDALICERVANHNSDMDGKTELVWQCAAAIRAAAAPEEKEK
jgi:hypothetical protein